MVDAAVVPLQLQPGFAPVLPDIPAALGGRGDRHDHAPLAGAGIGAIHRGRRHIAHRHILPVQGRAPLAGLLGPQGADGFPVLVCVIMDLMIQELRLTDAGVFCIPGPLFRVRIDLEAFLHAAGLRQHQLSPLIVDLRRAPQGPGPDLAALIGRGIPDVLVHQHRIQDIPLIHLPVEGTVMVVLLDTGDISKGFIQSAEISAFGTGPAFRRNERPMGRGLRIGFVEPQGIPGVQSGHFFPHRFRFHTHAEGNAAAHAVRGLYQFLKGKRCTLQVLPDLRPHLLQCSLFLRQIQPGVKCQKFAHRCVPLSPLTPPVRPAPSGKSRWPAPSQSLSGYP